MKFGTRLIIYYLVATLTALSLVGLAVLKGIEHYGMQAVEQQLIEQSESALVYVTQIYFLEQADPQGLNKATARRITNTLSAGNRQVRIYDQNLQLLSAAVDGVEQAVVATGLASTRAVSQALAGDYAYVVRNNQVYFATPIQLQGTVSGVLEFVYPLDFLNQVLAVTTRIFLIGTVTFGILSTLFSFFIAAKMVTPIKQLVAATNKYAERDFTPLAIERSDELGQLGHSFNRMGAELQEYIQRQKQFVSNVSHELRTPLTAIKGYSEYLVDEVKGQPDLEKAVHHLNNESARLTKMVNELLLLSRLDAQREALLLAQLDFTGLIAETATRLELRAQKYEVSFLIDLQPGIYLTGDREKLIQAVINLLDNAIKFSPAGSQIGVVLGRENDQAKLAVKDRGLGVPPGEIDKVFDRFYRAGNARAVGGTGLGLAITREIVVGHGGTITLSRRPGGGTVAEVTLPLAR